MVPRSRPTSRRHVPKEVARCSGFAITPSEKLSETTNTFYLLADESGAKGYASTAEKFPGEVGVFAGLIAPRTILTDLGREAKALERELGNGTKFHITALQPQDQEALRKEVCTIVRRFGLVCVYEAIYVFGFSTWFQEQKTLLESLPNVSRSGIRISRNTPEECLHDFLFQGLLGRAVGVRVDRPAGPPWPYRPSPSNGIRFVGCFSAGW